jgi:hypothetical protein
VIHALEEAVNVQLCGRADIEFAVGNYGPGEAKGHEKQSVPRKSGMLLRLMQYLLEKLVSSVPETGL